MGKHILFGTVVLSVHYGMVWYSLQFVSVQCTTVEFGELDYSTIMGGAVQYSTGGWYGVRERWCDAPLGQWQVTWKRPLNFFDKSAQALHKCCISMTAFWNTCKNWETMLKVGQMLKTNSTSVTSPKRTYMA